MKFRFSRMRRGISLLLLLMLLPLQGIAETVVTSFYPIWLITMNLTAGLEDITVRNMAAPDTGCLHDYQLQTADMKTLAEADALLVNGAGMESFLPEIRSAFPDLPVITASEGIPLLENTASVEIGESESEFNAHLWLDPSRAARMAENLAAGLISLFPRHEERISANLSDCMDRLQQLDQSLREGLSGLKRRDIITFHEAFPYFAEAYGLQVAAVVNREPGETPTASQFAELIRVVRELDCPPLFVEPQYEDLSARTLSAETGAPVYTLDPVVTGPEENVPPDYYETVMLRNMETLREALSR